ncbi:MAG: hypothetical protein JSV23_00345 [Promethearchaeota archaeon]|nr:MAG: hypothetical protein JSV23_00345 [Candidatus Lokiarchaeota archaeon]
MGLGKSFLFSILVFVGLNFIFTIVQYLLAPGGIGVLFSNIQAAPLMILYFLFGSIFILPSISLEIAIPIDLINPNIVDNPLLGIGYLVTPLIAAILAGRFGENKGQSFGGWSLTAVASAVASLIGAFLSLTFRTTLGATYGWLLFEDLQIYTLIGIGCAVNIIFYGFFALVVTKTEYY